MKTFYLLCFCLFANISLLHSARIVSGPIPYHFTHQMLSFGFLLEHTDSLRVDLIDPLENTRQSKIIKTADFPTYKNHTPVKFIFEGLKANYTYKIEVRLNAKKVRQLKSELKTALLPGNKDFSFMLGSCAYTPPKTLKWMHPGIEERIYPNMIEKETDFMLWMGDYLYYFKKHFKSFDGMMRRHVFKRKNEKLNKFLMSRPQYAAWDDHDYGPNNSDMHFPQKDAALEMWKFYWNNPAYGLDSVPGCFFDFSYQDCDFFMLDNRFYRTEESDTGAMLGEGQMNWLMQKLKNSQATFKFIMAGSQVFNEITKEECFCKYTQEREQLLDFINKEKISGIIWLSGDRHHSSLFKVEDIAAYPYYEYTCSAITTFRSKLKRSNEYINPVRVEGT
ncbi:MAG: alkaline phosphatase D family protein, partial [Chitinophagales bacterium]